MTAARRALHVCVVGSLIVLGLGLSLHPNRLLASYHGVFDHLDAADRQLAENALQETLENRRSGDLRLWRNDSTGNSGAFMPLRTFKIKTGHFCRDYRETAIANSRMASRDLTACRNLDGMWTMTGK